MIMKILLSICLFAAAMAFAVETNLTLTVDGVTYTGVRFGRVTPGSVVVFHSTGVATIPLDKLSAELQKQFDYDPQKAAVWRVLQQKAAEAKRKADAEAAAEAAATRPAPQPQTAAPQVVQRPFSPAAPPPTTACPGLRQSGAFGFPQKQAMVLYESPVFRLSVYNDNRYLFAQAVMWNDNISSVTNANGSVDAVSSQLALDLNNDGVLTLDVDRQYQLGPAPYTRGLYYFIPRKDTTTSHPQDPTRGIGAIRYVEALYGRRARVDSYLIPLDEISKHPGDRLSISFWGRSFKPPLRYSASGQNWAWYDITQVPFSSGQFLLSKGRPDIDLDKVPDDRSDPSPQP
jgi:hypothetical protein